MRKLIAILLVCIFLMASANADVMEIDTPFTNVIGLVYGLKTNLDWMTDETTAHMLAVALAADMFSSYLSEEEAKNFDLYNGYIGISLASGDIWYMVPVSGSGRFYVAKFSAEHQAMLIATSECDEQYRDTVMRMHMTDKTDAFIKLDPETLAAVMETLGKTE